MHKFGRANWWLPGWLDRILPHVSVEGGPAPEPAAAVAGIPAGRFAAAESRELDDARR